MHVAIYARVSTERQGREQTIETLFLNGSGGRVGGG
jgi:DNA invertase Pin-like site-specific DNA recombinase